MPSIKKKESRGPHILIVEDCAEQRELLRHILTKHKYVVEVAGNGQDALAKIRKNKPDVLFSDIQMPEMNGYELCRVVKKDPELKDIPVILLTAFWDKKSFLMGLRSGADFYFFKPMNRKSLLARTEEIIKGSSIKVEENHKEVLNIQMDGEFHSIFLSRSQILRQLISTYEIAVEEKEKNLIKQLRRTEPEALNKKSEFN